MFLCIACRNYRMNGGRRSTHEKSKLALMKQTAECVVEPNCAFLKSKVEGRMMLKLRVCSVFFLIEMRRQHWVKREENMCKECGSGDVGDVGMYTST